MEPHLLSSIVILLFVACVVAVLAKWAHQPYTIALVLVGLIISFTNLTPNIHLTHDLTFTIILPPLLFYGALHVDLERLLKNWRSILLLAIPGVLCSTFLIGFALHKIWGIELIYALLFGALITPTDPISVLAILKEVHAPKRLRLILEGESLFNDGTAVVVFSIILAMATGHSDFQVSDAILEFLKTTLGGTLIGFICGWLTYQVMKKIEDHLLEVALTVVLAFGTPLLADAFHCSGIIAVVVAGLIIGNYGKVYSMSDKVVQTLDNFWEVVDFIVNSIIFIVIGVELQVIAKSSFSTFAGMIFFGILAVVLARLIVVYPIVKFRNATSPNDIPSRWSHVLFWGGLRGSIPIALVLGMPQEIPHRNLFLTVAFSVVLFSLVVQGLTIKPLIARLGLAEK